MTIIKHVRSNWLHFGFETLAVVVGILIAFSIENWKVGRRLRIDKILACSAFPVFWEYD